MNESSITIRWEKNSDGSTDISVNGDMNYQSHFREAFLSLDNVPSVYCVDERETSGESAEDSATISLLSNLIQIIRTSYKTKGKLITERERDLKFPFTDLIVIKKFADIAGIRFDEQKFQNRR